MNHIAADPAELSCECLSWMRKTGKVVHMYRDVRDVIVAQFVQKMREIEDASLRNSSGVSGPEISLHDLIEESSEEVG